MNREERIQQIKDCGQTIIDNAEQIYGDYVYPSNLKIVIAMECNALPTISVENEILFRNHAKQSMTHKQEGGGSIALRKLPTS